MAYDKRIAVFNGCLLALAAGRCSGQSIVNIGVVPGATQSWAGAVSADGSVVAVGVQGTESYSFHAYTWTAAGGFEDFGAPNASFLGGMSGDGLTVVGLDYSAGGAPTPFRWNASRGFEHLPFELQEVYGTNVNGSIVIGQEIFSHAAIWSSSGGLQDLGCLPGLDGSESDAVSSDGTMVVGRCWSEGGLWRAFVWTEEAQMLDLGSLPGFSSAEAFGISGDGSVIVGDIWEGTTVHPVRWTEHGIEDLGCPAGYSYSLATRTNVNGTVVVGYSDTPDSYGRAFVWSPHVGGTRDLSELLTSVGVDMSGWVLNYPAGVSSDGRVIVGGGSYAGEQRGWVVTLPSLGTCCADFNGDGELGTDADIAAFFACLSGSCCPTCCSADFNGDGDVGTDADIESFFRVLAGASC